jgi:hypothetical protein
MTRISVSLFAAFDPSSPPATSFGTEGSEGDWSLIITLPKSTP